MAHLLSKLGKEALKPQLINGIWHKAPLSAKNAARIRKEALLQGQAWEFDEPRKEVKYRKPKGHKHDRLKPEREANIAANLEKMDEMIASSRDKRRNLKATLLDRILLTSKELRIKQREQR